MAYAWRCMAANTMSILILVMQITHCFLYIKYALVGGSLWGKPVEILQGQGYASLNYAYFLFLFNLWTKVENLSTCGIDSWKTYCIGLLKEYITSCIYVLESSRFLEIYKNISDGLLFISCSALEHRKACEFLLCEGGRLKHVIFLWAIDCLLHMFSFH